MKGRSPYWAQLSSKVWWMRLLRDVELPLHARRIALLPTIVRHFRVPPCTDYVRAGRRRVNGRAERRTILVARRPCEIPGRVERHRRRVGRDDLQIGEARALPPGPGVEALGDPPRQALPARLGHHQHVEQAHVVALDCADRHGHRPARILDEGEADRCGDRRQHALHGLAMLGLHRAVRCEGRRARRALGVGEMRTSASAAKRSCSGQTCRRLRSIGPVAARRPAGSRWPAGRGASGARPAAGRARDRAPPVRFDIG